MNYDNVDDEMEQNFPELLNIAKPKNDVLELTGKQFKVEEA
ncbi:hypothetical protein [Bacillus pseudomycoides]|nr:hypothetical protein [Bacillus pseudomycoides]